jgi:dihydropteroate synthase
VVDVAGAVEAARVMARAGATVIDVGGQSTRPGSHRSAAVQDKLTHMTQLLHHGETAAPSTTHMCRGAAVGC